MVFVLQMASKSVSRSLSLPPDPRGCVVCNLCQCGGKWVSTPVEHGCEVTPAQTRRAGDQTALLTQRDAKPAVTDT